MKVLIFILFLFITVAGFAQENGRWLGIRGGLTPGVEYRQFFSGNTSGKLLLGYRERGLLIHGLYEIHRKDLFPSLTQLSFIYGAGLHAGFQTWNETEKSGTWYYTRTTTGFVAGIDGLVSFEYELGLIPLTAGIEVKPLFDFGGRYRFHSIPWDFAFTLKLKL